MNLYYIARLCNIFQLGRHEPLSGSGHVYRVAYSVQGLERPSHPFTALSSWGEAAAYFLACQKFRDITRTQLSLPPELEGRALIMMAESVARLDDTTLEAHDNGAIVIKRPRTRLRKDQESQLRRRKEAQLAYGRGRKIPLKGIKDKKLRGNLRALEDKYKDATLKARDAEILLENSGGFLEPENELEKTYKVRQEEIKRDVPTETAKKGFELKLDTLGPYVCDYTRNGRELLLAGRKGHVATMDWREGKLGCELQLAETVRDARWLHNNQLFAVAQKKYVYIYDRAGVEIHCLKKHIEVTNMEFLPYHYLLATVVCPSEILYPRNLLTLPSG
jgi:hypothetical protein